MALLWDWITPLIILSLEKVLQGGTAGRSIRTTVNATASFDATLFNIDGTESTDGVWNGGMTLAEASGSSDVDQFVGAYMDTADQVWYMLFCDTGTTTDTLYFSKVNEAGTVTAIGNAQVGNASMDGMRYNSNTVGALRRLGGDGSGNFGIYCTFTSGGNAASAVPYRGVDITINASNGSLSYANIMPTTYGSPNAVMEYPRLGPSDNNIIGSISSQWWGSTYKPHTVDTYGGLANLTNGKAIRQINMGGSGVNNLPWTNGYHLLVERSANTYTFGSYYGTSVFGNSIVNEDELHAWLDEMAVYYGIL